MKPKATVFLVVVVLLFGIITIIQSNLAYATSSEKIPLVQKFEQFPGQEITGFCYLQIDDEGNLDWRIKVNGLESETQGFFDLGHWAGEVDVPFIADDDGKADSENQIVLAENFPHSLVSQFAKCQVLTAGYNHFTSPIIALGVLEDSSKGADKDKNQNLDEEKFSENNPQGLALGVSKFHDADVDKLKKENPTEKKFFLFAALDFLFGMFSNIEDESVVTNSNFASSTSSSNYPSPGNASSSSSEPYEDIEEKSTNKNSIKENKNVPEINSKVNTIKEEQGKADKGNGDEGNDKGKADKGNGDEGNDKGKADKGNGDRGKR